MRILIAGGGTAGHVFPAVALGQELVARGHEVVFVGTDRGLERDLVPAAGFELISLPTKPFVRKVSLRTLDAPFAMLSAAKTCRPHVENADIVVGMGGYASAPALIAARRANRPVVLHEQNAIPGAANRMFSSQARVVAATFEDSRARFGRARDVRLTGNPVRAQIRDALDERASVKAEAIASFDLDVDEPIVVVSGGSQGALHLDQVVAQAVPALADANVQVIVLAGRAHADATAATLGDAAVVLPFLDRMEFAYAVADLLVGRAGATTIAEASLWGLPMLLVPYPHATANHQEANARELERAGAAHVVLDANLEAASLSSMIIDTLTDRAERISMGEAASAWARPQAAADLAGIVEAAS